MAAELGAAGVRDEYNARPFNQRNDHLAWTGRAKRPETRRKRVDHMLDDSKKAASPWAWTHLAVERVEADPTATAKL